MYKQKKEVVLFGINPNIEQLKEYVPEIKVRMNKGKKFEVDTIHNGNDAYEILKRIYPRGIVQEHFVVLLFNRANKLIGYYRHTIGSTNATLADIPMLVAIATKSLAQSVVISHNHPSGNTYPSEADKNLTMKTKIALNSVGITMLDHIIYSEETYFSFADDGMLNGLLNTTTMITIDNILERYPHISQDSLPTALQENEFEFIRENIDLYNEDDTIKQYIDTFIDKLNQIQGNDELPFDYETENSNKTKQLKSAKPSKKAKVSKVKTEKKQETKSKDIVSDEVEFISPEIRFIKRYISLHDKSKDKAQILSFINSLQKTIVEKRIRKSSGYADIIEKMQDELIGCYNEMGKTVKLNINHESLEKYKEIAKSETLSAIVKFMKGVISIQGKSDVRKRAESLYKSYSKAYNNGDISHNDLRYKETVELSKSLIDYLQETTETVEIKESVLHGLQGFLGESFGSLGDCNANCISSTSLPNMHFQTIGLKGKYRTLIGDPSVGFTAMVFGLPKSGKSTLCIDFAKHLAEHHGKVLYVAVEEGFGYTLQEKFERLHAIHPNLEIAEKIPAQLSNYDFVFIDSVSKAGMTIEQMTKLHKQFPKTAFVFIFHSTKDGKFRGGQGFAHEVDCIVDVAEGVAKGNGRFGIGGEINVFND